jgi:hypothetical protein
MPTKKQPTPRQREIARKKTHPVAKAARVEVGQNAELQPRHGKPRA